VIRYWNQGAERLYGWKSGEALAKFIYALLDARFPEPLDEIEAGLLRNGSWEGELDHLRRDGTRIVVQTRWVLRRDSTGLPVAVMEINRDITAPKRAQEILSTQAVDLVRSNTELTALNKELDAFSYSVSHDLRAPLRSIDGFSRILVDEYGPGLDPTAQHYLQRVIKATQHMGCLVDDLLNLSKLGRKGLTRRLTPLDGLVRSVLEDLAQDTAGREIEWRIDPLPSLDCDASLIKIVFFNLLANAVKFTRPRQRAVIEVGAQETDGHWVIFVRDNGVGFNPKYADKLFGIFQRLHREDEFEGTGIGLATVQRIIHRHGGRIWAESQLDQGATFLFVLGALSEGGNSKELSQVGGVA
jgi:PAS domain S-box-containing protein